MMKMITKRMNLKVCRCPSQTLATSKFNINDTALGFQLKRLKLVLKNKKTTAIKTTHLLNNLTEKQEKSKLKLKRKLVPNQSLLKIKVTQRAHRRMMMMILMIVMRSQTVTQFQSVNHTRQTRKQWLCGISLRRSILMLEKEVTQKAMFLKANDYFYIFKSKFK